MERETTKTYDIADGDLVKYRDRLYQVRLKTTGVTCASQCSLYSRGRGRCAGLCYRYPDGGLFVFKWVSNDPDHYPTYDPIKETPWAEMYETMLAEAKDVLRKLRKMKGGE